MTARTWGFQSRFSFILAITCLSLCFFPFTRAFHYRCILWNLFLQCPDCDNSCLYLTRCHYWTLNDTDRTLGKTTNFAPMSQSREEYSHVPKPTTYLPCPYRTLSPKKASEENGCHRIFCPLGSSALYLKQCQDVIRSNSLHPTSKPPYSGYIGDYFIYWTLLQEPHSIA